MIEDPDRCYQAAQSKDARFDGWFFIGVTSTGIYCRPVCTAKTPGRKSCRFFASASALTCLTRKSLSAAGRYVSASSAKPALMSAADYAKYLADEAH